jgi:hypothetical protein
MRFRDSRGNNADGLFAGLLKPCVDDEEYRTGFDNAESFPSFLFVRRLVELGQRVGIVEGQSRRLEADVVLNQILPILILIPFETHGDYRRLQLC